MAQSTRRGRVAVLAVAQARENWAKPLHLPRNRGGLQDSSLFTRLDWPIRYLVFGGQLPQSPVVTPQWGKPERNWEKQFACLLPCFLCSLATSSPSLYSLLTPTHCLSFFSQAPTGTGRRAFAHLLSRSRLRRHSYVFCRMSLSSVGPVFEQFCIAR